VLVLELLLLLRGFSRVEQQAAAAPTNSSLFAVKNAGARRNNP
jgi:hypothetical protein